MALWANTDAAGNSTIFAASQVNKTPDTTEQTALFGNTTQDAYFTGAAVGQFGVTVDEMAAGRAAGERPAAAGWVLRTEGSGGRAGRVFSETLVAMKTISGDASDDNQFPEIVISFTDQPLDVEVDGTETANFSFDYVLLPDGVSAVVSSKWQVSTNNGASWSDISGETGFDLAVANTDPEYVDGNLFRVVASATGAVTVTTDSALLTITTP